MKENRDQPRKVSTCFEGSPGAEMFQKIMGEEGIGSLCEEMMRSLVKSPGERKEGPHEGPKKEGAGEKSDRGSEAVKPKNNKQNHGGLK